MKRITLPLVARPKKQRAKPNYTPEELERRRAQIRKMNADPAFNEKRLANLRKAHAQMKIDPVRREKQLAHMRKMNEKSRPKTRLFNYERYENPEERKKTSEHMKRLRQDPDFEAKRLAAGLSPQGRHNISKSIKRLWNKRRGFAVPEKLKAEYRMLTQTKRFRAREAGKILGLI